MWTISKRDESGGISQSYDRIAAEYARRLSDELSNKPLDRALLGKFAEQVRGVVCDLGCGPGHVARYLRGLGVEAFGLDLSQKMVEEARRLNPQIEFRRGDMLSLDFADDSWGGIVAFYSIIHVPREEVRCTLSECLRVLWPGGLLLVAFHVGEETRHLEEMWGRGVSLDFYFYRVEEMRRLLEEAGFRVEEVFERPPYDEDVEVQTDRAYIFAGKPTAIDPPRRGVLPGKFSRFNIVRGSSMRVEKATSSIARVGLSGRRSAPRVFVGNAQIQSRGGLISRLASKRKILRHADSTVQTILLPRRREVRP